jgi:hypothetical protein
MRRVLLWLALVPALACNQSGAQDREPPAASSRAPTPTPEPPPIEPPPRGPSELGLALADRLDASAFAADLRLIAAPRPPGSEHWQAVQDHCASCLSAAGFAVERVAVDGAGVSVVGLLPGRDPELPAIVVGAHYDHIEGCPGADDNASGTAAALALARTLAAQPGGWERSLYVACWDEEESGLHGSRAWVERAVLQRGQRFALYLNLDAIAYADAAPGSQRLPPGSELLFARQLRELDARGRPGDFIAVLADDAAHDASTRYLAHAERLGLPTARLEIPAQQRNAPLLADLRRSDHANFWKHEIPAVFLSDTADFRTDTYHCEGRPDTVETLDLEFATKVTRAAAGMLAELLGPASAP